MISHDGGQRPRVRDTGLNVRDTPLVTMLNSAVCLAAAVSAAVDGVSWLLTFTPWTRWMPSWYSVPLFFLPFLCSAGRCTS